MKNLFAPWRMDYIGGDPDPGCLFCRVRDEPEGRDLPNLVVHRLPGALIMLNKFPYNNGHLMVAPNTHVGSLADLSQEEGAAMMLAIQRSLHVLGTTMAPQGFNVGANIGQAAGAGIPGHVHVHLVPRWIGDTNFMPVLGQVKVVNEHLERSWERLRSSFGEEGAALPPAEDSGSDES